MSSKSKKNRTPSSNGAAASGAPSAGTGRGKGNRKPPMQRTLANVEKISKCAELVLRKLTSWESSGDVKVANAASQMKEILAGAQAAQGALVALIDEGFTPPKKSGAVAFTAGEAVAIKSAHHGRYAHAYPETLFKALTVDAITPVGDVVVKNGSTKFFVAKSHLEHRS